MGDYEHQEIGDAPIETRFKKVMQAIAQSLDQVLNNDMQLGGKRTTGFVLMVFPFDDFDGRCNYISSADRKDMIKVLREQLRRFEEQDAENTEATVATRTQ